MLALAPMRLPPPPRPTRGAHLEPATRRRITRLAENVACAFAVSVDTVLGAHRGSAAVARARHIVMYLAHVALGLSLGEVAELMGRDRSSVLFAARTIESLREHADMDRIVSIFEASLMADDGGAR